MCYATNYSLSAFSKNNFLEQIVFEPTRITEDTENILDLLLSNKQTLVNRVEVMHGISEHEAIYVESSLRPARKVIFIIGLTSSQ